MYITAEDLYEKVGRPYADQIKLFALQYPNGIEITYEVILEGFRFEWNVEWFAEHFLDLADWEQYEEAKAAALVRALESTDAAQRMRLEKGISDSPGIQRYLETRVYVDVEGGRRAPPRRRRRA